MLFGKKNKTQSYLGVDIGAGGIKIVELKKTKSRPQLWTYGIAEQELDIHVKVEGEESEKEKKNEQERIDMYASILKKLIKTAKVTTTSATASIPVSYIFHTHVTLPKVPPKEVAHHIEAKIKKMIAEDISEMQIVYQSIPSSNQKENQYLEYLVTAVPKRVIAFYTAIFETAGLTLTELETEAFALTRSLVGLDTGTCMIVDIGAQRTNFFIVDGGLPMTHRSIQLGGNTIDQIIAQRLGIDIHKAHQVKIDLMNSDPALLPMPLFENVFEPILKEIEYSFNMFLRQIGNENKKPEKIILSGGSAFFPIFVPLIKNKFPMRVFVGDPWARVVYQPGIKKLLDSIGPRMAVSIGLSMRNIL